MSAITKNLPWFIKDLGINIVGEKCYTSIVEDLDFTDVPCLKYGLSKGVGMGIVVGGSIMKVPQLMLILRARSARGLSLPSYILETLSYAITSTYAYRHAFPFSTYGENLFLTLQNMVITLLIINYPSNRQAKKDAPRNIAITAIGMVASVVALLYTPHATLSLLQLTTLPLSLSSKLPQIVQNSRAHSTGQLSAFAVISQVLGCIARLFTTAQEVGDGALLMASGFALALALNIVLGAQMYMYWGNDDHTSKGGSVDLGRMKIAQPVPVVARKSEKVDIVVPQVPMSPGGVRSSTPTGRKWARKVD